MSSSNGQSLFSDLALYPHFKLTRERFPRLLATRRVRADGAEYFGAFLPATGVRFLIDFLNKTFRLRGCELDLDGSFDVPCTQFYRRRCLAPCVASLCTEAEYAAQVELVRLFLRRDAGALERRFLALIEAAAAELDFERAALLRDAWQEIERLLTAKEWNFWLDEAVDSFEVRPEPDRFCVYLVTMRGRKTLGRRVFIFDGALAPDAFWPDFFRAFYRFHAPREIRVSGDFPARRAAAAELSRRFGREVKISVASLSAPRVTAERALERTRYEHEFRRIRREKTAAETRADLQRMFGLPAETARIEAFDVAHLAGRDFVAAKVVWENGSILGREDEFWFSDAASELDTLREFLARRYARVAGDFAALVLVDGGRAQLAAAQQALAGLARGRLTIAAAVKPPRRHEEIAAFLRADGTRLAFDGADPTHRLLQTLRDEAHGLSNEMHRQRREMAHHYELAAMLPSLDENARRELLKKAGSLKKLAAFGARELGEKFAPAARDLENFRHSGIAPRAPLVVPLRYTDENGDAQDLRPLTSYRAK